MLLVKSILENALATANKIFTKTNCAFSHCTHSHIYIYTPVEEIFSNKSIKGAWSGGVGMS